MDGDCATTEDQCMKRFGKKKASPGLLGAGSGREQGDPAEEHQASGGDRRWWAGSSRAAIDSEVFDR
ncbi:Hypp8758 [Branchiostoma lanceolatum]|uniref:Hypp8758 protein n=1 Tax=Branchiostoma lanceolatum TaxID=7740 RepID=A0A8J9Z904_BRALA|nr:Hypp8758 [Branchiostoma lanceolatum]